MKDYYKEGFVYALVDPEANVVFYIGQTSHKERRLQAHLNAAINFHKTNPELNALIRDLLSRNKTPQIVELQKSNDTIKDEIKWIKFAVDSGWPIVNKAVADEYKQYKVVEEAYWNERIKRGLKRDE